MINNILSKEVFILLLSVIIISAGVLFIDSFRDDDFCRYDSPYYSSIAQNILKTGNWASIYAPNGYSFREHPPLTFWITALSLKFLGSSAFSAVFPCLLFTVGTCVVAFFIGMILENEIAGFFSGVGLLLTRYVPRVARHNTIEIPVMFFMSLAVLSLILALKKHKSFYILFGISAAFVVLSKGILGIFPLGIAFFAIVIEGKIKDFWSPSFILGILAFLIIPGLWLFASGDCTIAGGVAALNSYIHFTFGAFKGFGHIDPGSRLRFITRLIEFCWLIIPGVFLGIFFVVKDYVKEKKKDSLILFVWVLSFIVAYLISSWRRGLYLIPMYPAMAVLFGIGIYRIIPTKHKMVATYLTIAFFVGNIVTPFLFPHQEPKTVQEVLYKDTYLPGAKMALNDINNQLGGEMKLVSYHQNSAEFIFFFSSDYDISVCENAEDFEKLVNSNEPIVFYISKENFSNTNKKFHSKLKIVYAFKNNLLVSNKTYLVPPFHRIKYKW